MADRAVVFASVEGAQIVRYERAGKWVCLLDRENGRQLTVDEAAYFVSQWQIDEGDGCWVYPGLRGGKQFYARLAQS